MKKIRATKKKQIKADGLLLPKYMSSLSALGFFCWKDKVGVDVLQNAICDDILLLVKLTLLNLSIPSYLFALVKFYDGNLLLPIYSEQRKQTCETKSTTELINIEFSVHNNYLVIAKT